MNNHNPKFSCGEQRSQLSAPAPEAVDRSRMDGQYFPYGHPVGKEVVCQDVTKQFQPGADVCTEIFL